MTIQRCFILPLAMLSFMSIVNAQIGLERDIAPLQNWPTPLYWHPTEAEAYASEAGSTSPRMRPNAVAAATNLPLGTNALVFVAMTPCRLMDTRDAVFASPFGPPMFG